MTKRISIVGLGLIGGSMGLALKQSGLRDAELVGYVRTAEAGQRALRLGAVDAVEGDLRRAVNGADLVVLATPVMAIKDVLQEIGPHLPPGCLVTDTASTKVSVMQWAEDYLPPSVDFIGGHPMAGKETSGIEAAEAGLFRDRTYCLATGRNASTASFETAMWLVGEIGAEPLCITAAEHDDFVAAISHLPLIVSSALVMATTRSPDWARISRLASTGYRDLSRLASQHSRMNRDICLTNRENIIGWIDEFTRALDRFKRLIAEDNQQDLEQAFIQAKELRERWLQDYAKGS